MKNTSSGCSKEVRENTSRYTSAKLIVIWGYVLEPWVRTIDVTRIGIMYMKKLFLIGYLNQRGTYSEMIIIQLVDK